MNEARQRRIAALSPDQIRKLVQKTVKERNLTDYADIKPRTESGNTFPLSFAQERLWFLAQLAPDSRAYNNALAVSVTATDTYDPFILEQCLNTMIERHEILRTTFHSQGGEPYQKINQPWKIKVKLHDLRHLPPIHKKNVAEKLAREEGRYPFDLERGPLLRFTLVKREEKEYLLLITTHHLISDGWSNGIFASELTILSEAYSRDQPSPLPPPAIQYADYTLWERKRLDDVRLRKLLGFWKNMLGETLPQLKLPLDHSGSGDSPASGALETIRLPREFELQLKAYSRRRGATLFQTLLAVLYILLHRYTGQEEIIIGTPAANRGPKATHQLLGFFVNTLILKMNIKEDLLFPEFLDRIKEVCGQAFSHQELPFEQLVRAIRHRGGPASSPVIQVLFAQQSIPRVEGSVFKPFKVDYGTVKFDLDFWMEETEEDLLLSLYYRKNLFSSLTIRRMLTYYKTLLIEIIAEPIRPLSRFPLLSPRERKAILASTTSSRSSFPKNMCVHHLFEFQADSHPEKIAVECLEKKITFGELNREANKLAHWLRRREAGPEVLIALLMNPSVTMITALLGILKSGSAYLPLDPLMPVERMNMILQDAAVPFLITEESFRPLLKNTPVELICLDSAKTFLKNEDSSNPESSVSPRNTVYVIYTSGTAGTPKGVVVEHRQLLHYIDAVGQKMTLPRDARLATPSTLAADLGNTTLFSALCRGGTAIIIPRALATDPEALKTYFQNNPVHCLKIVPSHLEALLTVEGAADILPGELLILGGEASSFSLINSIRALAPRCRIMNHYGPTETSVGVLTWELPSSERIPEAGYLPLGFPLPRIRAYILDKHLEPVPPGIPGELYISGAGLARGYLNNQDLTSQRFPANPFNPGKNSRLYKTGDRVRSLPGGAIEFLGRTDRQIKIRGYRVEPEEIESLLQRHEFVKKAVITRAGDNPQAGCLIAYIVSVDGKTEKIRYELQDFLKRNLPEYMRPRALIFLPAIPFSTNGKIDYKKLPRPDHRQKKPLPAIPRDVTELKLLRIWETLLGVHHIGITDSFFDLGGHSLLAIRLMSIIKETFGRKLPLAALFKYRNIRQLAEIIRKKGTADKQSALVAIQPEGTGAPLFFVHPAGGNVLCYYALSEHLGRDRPFYGLQVASFAEERNRTACITTIADTYIKAIRSEFPSGPYILGGWSMGAVIAFEMARRLERKGTDIPLLILLDQKAPVPVQDTQSGKTDIDALMLFAGKVEQLSGRKLNLSPQQLKEKTEEEQGDVLLKLFIEHNLVPSDTGLTGFRNFLALQKAHNLAIANYTPQTYHGQTLLFRGTQNPPGHHTGQETAALGWENYTSVEVVRVPGNHISMLAEPDVRVLADKMKHRIRLATTESAAFTNLHKA